MMFKRIGLFLMVNFLVMITISLVLNILGVGAYLTQYGIDYSNLMVFCLVWGMGGAFISLLLSKVMAKFAMGVQIIDPQKADARSMELVDRVHDLARRAGLTTMPEVGVYDSPEVNAFATGPTKSNSLVAVSTGLLNRMNGAELEGVLAHEVAHIANGDMVTMTLIQGVVNAFVMFLARVIAFGISQASRDDEGEGMSYFAYHMTVFVLEMVFMVFGTMVVAWFSRYREFRADAGGAKFAGREKMTAALEKLRQTIELEDPRQTSQGANAFSSMKISNRRNGWAKFFSTHPPLEERIARLQSFSE
ncbi:MAG: protease HtpX [Bdellovibrionaceae bacterium]|nr:protease HtpX [Pseudobdellovibrionaceae bacterium]